MRAIVVLICVWLLNFGDLVQCVSFSAQQLYILRGNLQIRNAGINENYEVWYNGKTRKSRVDFYDGMDKLFREYNPELRKYVYHKIYPASISKNTNVVSCKVMNATNELISSDQNSYLPIKNYSFVKNENLGGIKAQKWMYVETIYAKDNVQAIYTIWVNEIWTMNGSKKIIPVRYIYEMRDKNKVLDSYQHDYTYFEEIRPEDTMLQVPLGISCESARLSEHEPIDPLMEFINPSIERTRVTKAFHNFKIKYNKKYSTEGEHQNRLSVFMKNMRYINSFNRQHKSYNLAINHLADRTDDELSTLMRSKVTGEFIKGYNTGGIDDDDADDGGDDDNNNEFKGSDNNLERELDWRKFGAITEIKDQTTLCGSCYAFVTAAAVESAAYIQRGCKHLEEASEQAVIDCSWVQSNQGCDGGWLGNSLEWVKQNGLPLKNEYGPYLDIEGVCHVMKMTKLLKINNYEEILRIKKNIKKAIQKKGPLLAAVNSKPRSFLFYANGVYDDPECYNDPSEVNHGVTLIGYGKIEPDLQYWIIKNSFGKGWGEDGYMRIAIKENVCGVKNYLYSVEYNKISHVGNCYSKYFSGNFTNNL